MVFLYPFIFDVAATAIAVFLNWYSYRHLKRVIVARRQRDLNICCGNTDGGGVNVDILQHTIQ